MFERSPLGQQNRAIFLDVDLVCYVEGGGGISHSSDDSYFWRKVFAAVCPDLRVSFIAKGGKPILESLARSIIEDNVGRTIVAMDADYDRIEGDLIRDDRVLYTFGYSWENDVFDVSVLLSVAEQLSKCPQDRYEELKQVVEDAHGLLVDRLAWPAKADYTAFKAGQSLLPRDKPGRVIQFDNLTGFPIVKRDELLRLAAAVYNECGPPANLNTSVFMDIPRYLVGHVYSHGCLGIVRGAARLVKRNVSAGPQHILDLAFGTFFQILGIKGPMACAAHYHEACSVAAQK